MVSVPSSYMLSIDRVGSYRLLLADEVLLQGPTGNRGAAHINILGPLSREQVVLRRVAGGYRWVPRRGTIGVVRRNSGSVQPHSTEDSRPTGKAPEGAEYQRDRNTRSRAAGFQNDFPTPGIGTDSAREQNQSEQGQLELLAKETACLPGEVYYLAPAVTCRLELPSPMCGTAVLQVEPRDRLQERCDGLLLLDRLLVLGPGERSHVVCPHWSFGGAVVYQGGRFHFRAPLAFPGSEEVLGNSGGTGQSSEKIELELVPGRSVRQGDIGLYLEEM